MKVQIVDRFNCLQRSKSLVNISKITRSERWYPDLVRNVIQLRWIVARYSNIDPLIEVIVGLEKLKLSFPEIAEP
jgi:hypothetical protein